MRNYNQAPPAVRTPLHFDVEIGWAHTVEGDELVLTLDEAGKPIPNRYRIPGRVTAQAMLDGVKGLDADRLAALQSGGPEAMVELVGAVLGDDLVLRIAADPTVDSDAFMTWIADTVAAWGLVEALPDGPGN